MSWKGFSKAVSRLPHQITSTTGISEKTIDATFESLVEQFTEFHDSAKKLYQDSQKFKDSFSVILDYQVSFSQVLAQVFSPVHSAESPESQLDPSTSKSVASALQLEALFNNARDNLKPELQVIELQVIEPVSELIKILENVKKMITKRNHKLLDYDRFKNSLKSLQDKKDRNSSDEKKMSQLETQTDAAGREYHNVNGILMQEIPVLLGLRGSFMDPIFQTLYWYQLRVYSVCNSVLEKIMRENFDGYTTAAQVFSSKQAEMMALLDSLSIVKRPLKENPVSAPENRYSQSSPTKPPPYSETMGTSFAAIHGNVAPVKTPTAPSAEYAVALYDYTALDQSDLSFKRDDKIEILERTGSDQDWWKGRLNGKVGMVPANYLSLIN